MARSEVEILIGPIVNMSSIYKTAPWGVTNQPDFLNQVIVIETALKPAIVLDQIHSIEKHIGRVRVSKWEARLIDIDILFYDQETIHTNELTIPHPRISSRRFVLVPLNEIAPEFEHPQFHKKIADLLAKCEDTAPVTRTNL